MLHLNYNDFNLNKIFLEVRFRDSFTLPKSETRYELLEKLTKKYPLYNTDNPEQLSFHNNDFKQELTITLNRLIIDWSNPTSLDDFLKSSLHDINTILKQLQREDIQRIGIRSIHSFEGVNMNSVTQFIFKEYINSTFQNNSFGDYFYNPRVTFSGKKDNIHFNFGIGYQQQQIIEGKFGAGEIKQDIKELLAVDLDVYKENIKLNKLQNIIHEARMLNQQLPSYLKAIRADNYATK